MRTVITSSNLLDINTGTYTPNQVVVLKNRKIGWIGDEGSFEKEENDLIIDATGKFIIPGLIDCHVHLDFPGSVNMERFELNTPTSAYSYVALLNAQKHLISGFTTVRDAGSRSNSYPAVKNTIAELQFAGSRIFGSYHFLSQPGTQENERPDYMDISSYKPDSGPIGMREAVRKRISNGADWIKIEGTGGVLHGKHSVLNQSYFADDELDAIVSEAHRMNRYVLSHCHGDEGIYRGTKAGIDTIEHGTFVSEDSAKLMIKNGTYLVGTKNAVEALLVPEVFAAMTPEVQNRIKDTAEKMKENHKMAFDKGVNFALGTDAGTPLNTHSGSAKELVLLRDHLEIDNLRALQIGTIDAAKALKQESFLGSIDVGKAADMLLLDKNPLEDVRVLQDYNNISRVIKDGISMAERGRITYTLDLSK